MKYRHVYSAFTGRVMHRRYSREDETSVGATLVVALNLGRHEACAPTFRENVHAPAAHT